MKTTYTSQAVIYYDWWFIFEENKRFNWKLTLLWWKLEDWEDFKSWLLRELREESWINFSKDDLIEINNNDKLVSEDWENEYIARIYLIILKSKDQVKTILSQKQNKNVFIESSKQDLSALNYAFSRVYEQVETAIEYLENN